MRQCHGIFGESAEVFTPLIGGTTAEDVKTGRVANLRRTDFPSRTMLMKVSTLSTVLDFIYRAMPWTTPKSLSMDEVYAVTAFMLNLGGVVPDDFTLSDKNVAEVQKRMPNRNGMTTAHAMWPGKEFRGIAVTDTHNIACMHDCATEPKVSSLLPDFARNAHGNLAEQNRLVGPQRGANTTRPEPKTMADVVASARTDVENKPDPIRQRYHSCNRICARGAMPWTAKLSGRRSRTSPKNTLASTTI